MSTRYKAIQASNLSDLTMLVDQSLEDGWVCQGGIAVATSIPYSLVRADYVQAMVKQSKEDS